MARVSIPGQSKATINDPPQRRRAVMISANEVGRVGTFDVDGHIRDDIVPELSGSRGRVVYQRMRADATVSSIIFAIEMMLRRAKWSCVPKDPQDSKCIEYAQFFDSIRGDMYQTWEQFISNCLSMLVYGWSWFEIVGKRRTGADGSPPSKYSDGMWGIHKLAFRSQDSLERWQLNDIGEVTGMIQHVWGGPTAGEYTIPLEKSLHFRAGFWRDSPEGISPLRGAYTPWLLLQGINRAEAYGIERELNGLPVIKIPADVLKAAREGDTDAAQAVNTYTQIVRDVRLNKQAGVILPSDYYENADGTVTSQKQYELSLLSSNGTRAINVQAAAERHQVSIARCVLADFLMLGTTSRSGSQALGQSRFQFFANAADGWNDSIAEVLNTSLIPRIAKMNGMDSEYLPSFKAESVSRVDIQILIDCIERYVRAGGVLLPDPAIDSVIRNRLDLPPLDEERLNDLQDYDPTLDPRSPKYANPNDMNNQPDNPDKDPNAQGNRGSEGGAPKGNANARKRPTRQDGGKRST